MPMTITEKILARAAGAEAMKPRATSPWVDVETAVLMDMSFLPEGWREILHVRDPSKVVIAFDHLVPAPTSLRGDRAFHGPQIRREVWHRATA